MYYCGIDIAEYRHEATVIVNSAPLSHTSMPSSHNVRK